MKRSFQSVAIAAAAVLAGFSASAQQRAEESQATRNAWQDSLAYDEYLGGRALKASELIGARVQNERGESLGEVKDLIVSRADDVVEAVIAVGGVLGIGEKEIGVPYERLRVSSDGDTLFLAMTREQLEAQPAYDPERGGETAGRAAASGAAAAAAAAATQAAAQQRERAAQAAGQPPQQPGQQPQQAAQQQSQQAAQQSQQAARQAQQAEQQAQRAEQQASRAEQQAEQAGQRAQQQQQAAQAQAEQRAQQQAQQRAQQQADQAQTQQRAQQETDQARQARQQAQQQTEQARQAQQRAQQETEQAQQAQQQQARQQAEAERRQAEQEQARQQQQADRQPGQTPQASRPAEPERGGPAARVEVMDRADHRATDLIGTAVVDTEGEQVGEIDDLVVSPTDGRIHAVLAVGGVLGVGERLVSVPLEELEIEPEAADGEARDGEPTVRLRMTSEELESRPQFRYDREERTAGVR